MSDYTMLFKYGKRWRNFWGRYIFFTLKRYLSEYWMTFPRRTNTDYAIKENSILYDLDAVTVCFFARVDPNESTGDNQCLYSYAVYEDDNELTVCTSPMLRVLIQGNSR